MREWPGARGAILLPESFSAACTDSTGWRMPLLVNEGKDLLGELKTECGIRTGRMVQRSRESIVAGYEEVLEGLR